MMQHQKIETNITCLNPTNFFEKQKGREALLPSVNFIYKEKEQQTGKKNNRTSFISNTIESHTTP
jgi:hypothetical protein